jgi:hypothetical protein
MTMALAECERTVADTLAARLGSREDDPYPTLVASVCFAAMRVGLLYWRTSCSAPSLPDLLASLLDRVAAGLPPPSPRPVAAPPDGSRLQTPTPNCTPDTGETAT